jgi:hypothetical protein
MANRITNSTPRGASDLIDVVALVKNDQQYIILYDHESRAEALRTLGRWACDPELNFTWADAKNLSPSIKD